MRCVQLIMGSSSTDWLPVMSTSAREPSVSRSSSGGNEHRTRAGPAGTRAGHGQDRAGHRQDTGRSRAVESVEGASSRGDPPDSLPRFLQVDQRVRGVPGEGARAQSLVVLPPGGIPTRLAAVARLRNHRTRSLNRRYNINFTLHRHRQRKMCCRISIIRMPLIKSLIVPPVIISKMESKGNTHFSTALCCDNSLESTHDSELNNNSRLVA